MTYLTFLLLFVVLPAVLFVAIVRPNRREWLLIGAHIVLAYIWTTPWDNYLVATGVWSYDPDLVLGITLGWVPLEEYLFFGIMTILCGTLVAGLVRMGNRPWMRVVGIGALVVVLAALALSTRETPPAGARPWTYFLLIVGWAIPPLALQWAVGWRVLTQSWPLYLVASLLPAIYLSAADSIALAAGTWHIAEAQTFNIFLPGHVPVEEGLFFFVTTLMIVQGMILASSPEMQARFAHLLRRPEKQNRPA